ncbi:hypothetical protein CORC01_00881 [Colletotrichum orchidophilum]|uniref:SMP domain-containing protein n=1 Tax=Colletotrichum orchidophilum TaxID=1209926 RepID=A0A1G4BRD2_9PEZI|nr:uncharacterized protein CORC01_00881 [Colletotrichum orchidophilum]OHF04019.1 hypothetical protein CORC01_00881 [Colletotrichum orchidophilum]
MSAQYNKAPSAGAKVEPGSDVRPTRSEATGPVLTDSLAAESASKGGEFASNGDIGASATTGSFRTVTSSTPVSGAAPVSDQAAEAPTYVNNQYVRDHNGPHGRGITEGFDTDNTKNGMQAAFNAEVGSKNDPGRVAEQGLLQSQTKAGRDAGPRQTKVGGQTVYERLKSDVQA